MYKWWSCLVNDWDLEQCFASRMVDPLLPQPSDLLIHTERICAITPLYLVQTGSNIYRRTLIVSIGKSRHTLCHRKTMTPACEWPTQDRAIIALYKTWLKPELCKRNKTIILLTTLGCRELLLNFFAFFSPFLSFSFLQTLNSSLDPSLWSLINYLSVFFNKSVIIWTLRMNLWQGAWNSLDPSLQHRLDEAPNNQRERHFVTATPNQRQQQRKALHATATKDLSRTTTEFTYDQILHLLSPK